MDTVEKARQTRIRNQEAQARRYSEQAETIRAARSALTKVFESSDATPGEVLEAARLLAELSKPYY